MERKRPLNCNYRPRYFNTERQMADIQPGENVAKYIRDFFDAAAREHLISSPSLSASTCSSPDLNQEQFPPASEKKTKLSSVSSASSSACSQPRPGEASSLDNNVFLVNSHDEDEMCFGSPAFLNEEPDAPRDPELASPNQKGSLLPSSASQVLSPLSWDTSGSELENEDNFVIAESFGGPSASWLLQPKKNSPPKERSLPSPRLASDMATQEPGTGNVCSRNHLSAVDQGNSFSKQPTGPPALRSSNNKQIRKEKCPKNVPSKKQAERQSSAGEPGRKLEVLVLEEDVESEANKQCDKQPGTPPGDRLIPSGKKSAPVSQKCLVSPEDECGGSSTQEGSCEAEQAFPSADGQNSRTLSVQSSSVRAIHMDDLSGPVYKAKDIISHSKEALIRGHMEDSFSEPLEEDSSLLPSDSLKDQAVRPPDNTARLRRSRRLRLKPLEYWRGERVMYQVDPSGGLVASGIISPEQKEPHKLKRIKEPMEMDLEKVLENTNAALKDISEPALIFDAASKQEVLQECVSSGHSHLLFFSNEDVSIYKYFSTPLFSAGKLVLKPFKEKGSQYSSTDTLVFHIVKGRLLFTLYGQSYSLRAGNYFYVPAGNIYNIQNILNEECIVVFTQIKGNRQTRLPEVMYDFVLWSGGHLNLIPPAKSMHYSINFPRQKMNKVSSDPCFLEQLRPTKWR